MRILLYEPVYWDDWKSFISHIDEKVPDAGESISHQAFPGKAYNVVITKTKSMSDFGGRPTGENESEIVDDLNVVLERLNHSCEQLTDVKRQVAITGKVIDLYWLLQSKSISLEDYRLQLMTVLQEW